MSPHVTIRLRGVVAPGLGRSSLEVPVPAGGMAASRLLASAADADPRLERYLQLREEGSLRVLVNGKAVQPADDPTVFETDDVVLLAAVAGG
jgi:ThiS family